MIWPFKRSTARGLPPVETSTPMPPVKPPTACQCGNKIESVTLEISGDLLAVDCDEQTIKKLRAILEEQDFPLFPN
ncbi:hypothetical protein ACJJIU_22110 (plasmid) [Microbulbifer sp. CnH-101-E]|uniref:hypothetical protein n=1 Tax=unclassified Microbulbifer TaxID=2619833 RepID=UPI00403A372A